MGNTVAKQSKALALKDVLPEPKDLDDWTSDDVSAALDDVVGSFRVQRLKIGLLLWKYRALNVDAVYSDKQAEVAQACDVDVRTLQRWRVFAEKKWALPPPDRRTEGKRAAVERAKVGDKGTTSVSSANSREQDTAPEPEKVKPDRVVVLQHPEPEVLPPKNAQLSLFEEREGRLIVPARPPANREEVLAAKRIAKAYLDWAATAPFEAEPSAATPNRSNPYASKPNHASNRRAPARAEPKAEKCLHPVTRRIGGNCAACGAKVGAK